MRNKIFATLAAMLAIGALADPAAAQRRDHDRGAPPPPMLSGDWDELGCVDVGRRSDRDVIEVGRQEGRYVAIRFKAFGKDIDLDDVRVIYGNGQPDEIRVRDVLREGDETRVVDLQGRDRFIKQIEATTRKAERGFGRGKLCAYGLKAPPAPRPDIRASFGPDWEELGCVDVGRRGDVDTIDVGRKEGRYVAVRFVARERDIEIGQAKVVYGNGEPDKLDLRATLRDGDSTKPIDLEGRSRFIARIEVASRKAERSFGRGQLCAYGLKAPAGRPDIRAGFGPDWDELGCVDVGRRGDIDVIEVGRREGRYVAVRFVARDKDVEINRAKVVYGNGQPDNLNVGTTVRDGEATRPIDLEGRERFINRIEIASRKAERGFGRGQLCAYGLKAPRDDRRGGRDAGIPRGVPVPPQPADWVELGCAKISFGRDNERIDVGRQEGRFKAVRILAFKNDVNVDRITVNYSNGQPDVLAVGGTIRKNAMSQPLDLKGRERSIRSVNLTMRTKVKSFGSLLRGQARVCIQGLQ